MIVAEQILNLLARLGVGPATGVPDSTLTSLLAEVAGRPEFGYVAAVGEGEAMGIAAGWALAGKMPVVLMQNSGLGNAVNPLTSLHQVFGLPALMIIGWRGQPGGGRDSVEHGIMGGHTLPLLEFLDVPYEILSEDQTRCEEALTRLADIMKKDMRPVALVVKAHSISGSSASEGQESIGGDVSPIRKTERLEFGKSGHCTTRQAVEAIVASTADDTAVIGTTGYIARMMYERRNSPNHFYMIGSMGCAAAIGFAVSNARPDKKVVVLDGDGALLMKMGSMATIGHYGGPNLLHVVVDNGCYASTGGQRSVSNTVDFTGVAASVGYKWIGCARTPEAVAEGCRAWLTGAQGPGLLHVPATDGKRPTARPSESPTELRDRFMAFLK